MNIYIREAKISDADAISSLSSIALGYDYPLEETAKILNSVLCSPQDKVYVAADDNRVVGYIHANTYVLLYSPRMANIMGLAVSPDYRRMGIGTKLVEEVEKWAHSMGLYAIRLNSGGTRKEAHIFYRKCGFDNEKMQLRFIKEL